MNPRKTPTPQRWTLALLDDISIRGSGHTPNRKVPAYWNGGIKWVSLADSKRLDQRIICNTKYEISKDGIKNSSASQCPAGTVILSRDAGVGKSAVTSEAMAVSQHFITWQCGNKLNNYFLYYWLQWNKHFFERMAVGSTIKTIGLPLFKKLTITLPKALPEQKKIAAILSTWDRAIDQQQTIIAAKTRRKHGLMQQLLTGKKRLPNFKGKWESYKLSSLLEHTFRPVDWNPEDIYDLISVRRRSNGIKRREKLAGKDYKTTDLHTIKSGDFLISKRQVSHGALAMVTPQFDGCHVSKEYTILTNKDPNQLHMPFFDWLSKTSRLWWLTYVTSNGVVREKLIFAPADFLKFKLNFPSTIKEQKAIAQVLDTATREIETHQQQLTSLREQKRGLMQKLLTGEIRVMTS